MKFEGKVTSGLRKAGGFIQKEVYQEQYLDKLGFKPYPGTLNIKLNKGVDINIKKKYEKRLKIIEGNNELGDVYFLMASISNDKTTTNGAILFPTKTVHKFDTLEFVSEEKLRDSMKLNDDSKVVISI
ncbi:MAG: hypothetical protein BZ138_02315 [Methanosphaera sp. rholeuAM270]|nr:MAG: hypothetical protein BZ138_02315 [Methanosphaera sp. rholeuAM270]